MDITTKRVLSLGKRFYPEPFASEEPFLDKRLLQGLSMGSIKNPFHPKNHFWKEGLLQAWLLRDLEIFKHLPMFQIVYLNVDLSGITGIILF